MIQISQITILYPAGTQAQALANALAGQLKHYRIPRSVRAQSGIASIQDAEDFINLGAERLGTSRIVKIVKTEGLL